jgi:hypothetical protein
VVEYGYYSYHTNRKVQIKLLHMGIGGKYCLLRMLQRNKLRSNANYSLKYALNAVQRIPSLLQGAENVMEAI